MQRAQGWLQNPDGRALSGFAHDYKRDGTTRTSRHAEAASFTVVYCVLLTQWDRELSVVALYLKNPGASTSFARHRGVWKVFDQATALGHLLSVWITFRNVVREYRSTKGPPLGPTDFFVIERRCTKAA